MKNIIISLAAIMCFNSFAFDVTGQKQAIIVEQHPSKDLISLKHCLMDKSSQVIVQTCEQIGTKEYYSKSYLKEVRVDEYVEASLKTLADVGLIVVAAFVGLELGAAALSAEAATLLGEIFFGSIGGAAGGVTGFAIGAGVTASIDKMNPVRQFKQPASLSNDLINDIDTKESDEAIVKTVELLNEIL